MTRDELLALPAVVDLATAARAWAISRNRAYELAGRGEFPCPVQRLGNSYRVVTEQLLASLGIERSLVTLAGVDTRTQHKSHVGPNRFQVTTDNTHRRTR